MAKAQILLIEDDESLRQLYTEILMQAGYTVETAEDGEKGYQKVKAGGWDLILLDIILPMVNGLQIARRVRKEPPQTPNKAIIFLTNMYTDAQYKEALELGNGYLVKVQLTPDVLLQEVKKYVSPEKASSQS